MLETASGCVRSSRNSALVIVQRPGSPGGAERQTIATAELVTTAGRNATPFEVCQLWLEPLGPKPPRLLFIQQATAHTKSARSGHCYTESGKNKLAGLTPETSKMYRWTQWDLIPVRGVRSHCLATASPVFLKIPDGRPRTPQKRGPARGGGGQVSGRRSRPGMPCRSRSSATAWEDGCWQQECCPTRTACKCTMEQPGYRFAAWRVGSGPGIGDLLN